jgi:succinate dehydrogenase flavin-adding protein (antitoxin of CptAB toxin-antitoxin module)
MLELDATLLAFLERAYPGADPALQAAFEALLDMDDSHILDLITGNSAPVSPLQARLLALLARPLPAASG